MTPDQFKLLREAYYAKEGNACGGNLHIVLDDQNLDNHSVKFCLKYAADRDDADGVHICKLLLSIPYFKRLLLDPEDTRYVYDELVNFCMTGDDLE